MTERSERLSDAVHEWLTEEDPSMESQGLVLFEEGGELAEEVLKADGNKLYKDCDDGDLAAEIGDVAFTLWTIGLLAGVDPMKEAMRTAHRNLTRAHGGESDAE